MNFRTIGLKISSVSFGLISLGLLAQICARPEIVIGSFYLGRVTGWTSIIITGGLAIWMAMLAGPWFRGLQE